MSLKMTGNNHRALRKEQEQKAGQPAPLADETRDHGAFKQEDECGAEHPEVVCAKKKRDPLAPTPKTVL